LNAVTTIQPLYIERHLKIYKTLCFSELVQIN
jgi:hypothetical protein